MRQYYNIVFDHQITFIPYFPLASGILAGKYDENTKFSDHRTTRRDFKPGVFEEMCVA